MNFYVLIITLAIITGQLIKIPLIGSGATILDLVTIIFCLIGIINIKFKLTKPPFFILSALIFILISTLSLIFTPLSLSLNQYFSSFLYIIRFSIFVLLGWLVFSKAFPILNIEKVLTFSGVSIAVLGLMQFIILPDLRFLAQFGWDPHLYRTVSTFLDPNFLGAFLVLALLLITQNKSMFKPKIKVLFFTITYTALATTFSRSSYLMFLTSFIAFSFIKKSFKLTLLTILLFSMLLIIFQIYIRGVNTITPLDRNDSATLRLTTWQQGVDIFLKNPLLGVGFNTYNLALKQYKLGDEQFIKGHGATTNDSSLVYVAATTGVIGLLSFLLFLFSLIIQFRKKPILSSAVAGLLAHSIFVNSLFYPFLLIWIFLYASNAENAKNSD